LRVGILGGAFNPPHLGHLVCAEEALVALGLERVLFVPVGEAPHRTIAGDPGAETRLELCRAAVEGDDRFEVARLELDREGPSYSVDTLRELAGEGNELVLILGGDQAAELFRWRDPEGVLELARVAVAARSELGPEEVQARLSALPGARERLEFFSMPRIDVSSTLVRERVADGLPIRYLVPAAVEAEIVARGLYRAEAATG
jgi:nicotinate-nucleotide adenylyltransferase